jgi:hypothetical protein
MADPADLVREACTQLARYLPQLGCHARRPSVEGPAPGVTGRPAAAPVPGNPPAFYAYTSIQSSSRWAEDLLLYAVGAATRGEDERPGGSDAVTVRLLTKAIPRLAAGVDDDTYGLVLRELEQRLREAMSVRAIDEAQQWRPVPSRPCPRCRCYFLKVLIDAAGQPTGRVGCFGHLESGEPCRASWGRLAEIAQDLERAETAPGSL